MKILRREQFISARKITHFFSDNCNTNRHICFFGAPAFLTADSCFELKYKVSKLICTCWDILKFLCGYFKFEMSSTSLCVAYFLFSWWSFGADAAEEPPNIIVMLMDDVSRNLFPT